MDAEADEEGDGRRKGAGQVREVSGARWLRDFRSTLSGSQNATFYDSETGSVEVWLR